MLTDAECRNATCPAEKKFIRLYDAGGMYLQVGVNGTKRWFLKFRLGGKEKQMALGSYPDVGLTAARKRRDEAKLTKSTGVDPIYARKVDKLKALNPDGDTFQEVATEWYTKQAPGWSDAHAVRMKRQLERDLYPWVGVRRMRDIGPAELLTVLRKVEERGALETADRALMLARQVWDYAVVTQRAEVNITSGLKKALTPYRGTHFAAITDPARLGELLRATRAYKGGTIVRAALRLAPMLMVRPGELRGARWSEIDLDGALWTIPAERMKREKEGKESGDPHLVPLPAQAVEILRALQSYTGGSQYVFPGERSRDRPMSENSVRTALITLGYTPDVQTWHGFRATARTMLAERLEVDPLIIEAQLAHAVKDANGRAYNRTTYLRQRTKMMQEWADYLGKLEAGAEIIPLHRSA